MELDEENVSASLLEQMNCLQTLDKDDLISQMLNLIGGGGIASSLTLSPETAKFFLEMNGWNIQAAVCSYFDLEAGPEAKKAIPSMTFVKDVTIGEGESVPPQTSFVKTWTVQNSGSEPWPEDCILRHTDGLLMTSNGQPTKIVGRRLMPQQKMDLSVEMISPAVPGIYQSHWRMSTKSGIFFGEPIWAIISVERSGTLALTQQMNNFNHLGSSLDPTLANDSLSNDRSNLINGRTHSNVNPFSPRKSDQHME